MAQPVVWSERNEPSGGAWRDCTYCSGLMVLIGAGYTNFPEGIYTVAERELLERSDSRADETGAYLVNLDEAVKFRYGKAFSKPTDKTAAGLRRLLNTPGLFIVLQGDYSRIAAGHMIRRWQPGYVGGHAVAVMTRGDGTVLWLDPLATWKYTGDIVSIDLAMQFAYTGGDYQRYLKRGELATVPDTATKEDDMTLQFTIIQYALPRRIVTKPPIEGYAVTSIKAYAPPVHTAVKSMSQTKDSWFTAAGEVKVKGWNPKDPSDEYEYWLAKDGYFAGLWVAKSRLTVPEPMPALDCSVQVREAVDPLNAKLSEQTGIIASLKTDLAEAEKAAATQLSRAEAAEAAAKAAKALADKGAKLRDALRVFLS